MSSPSSSSSSSSCSLARSNGTYDQPAYACVWPRTSVEPSGLGVLQLNCALQYVHRKNMKRKKALERDVACAWSRSYCDRMSLLYKTTARARRRKRERKEEQEGEGRALWMRVTDLGGFLDVRGRGPWSTVRPRHHRGFRENDRLSRAEQGRGRSKRMMRMTSPVLASGSILRLFIIKKGGVAARSQRTEGRWRRQGRKKWKRTAERRGTEIALRRGSLGDANPHQHTRGVIHLAQEVGVLLLRPSIGHPCCWVLLHPLSAVLGGL